MTNKRVAAAPSPNAMIGPNRFVGQINSLTLIHQLGVTQPYYLLSRMPLVAPTFWERLALDIVHWLWSLFVLFRKANGEQP